ncbi:uncharacterized protein LOC141617643 [Silene latifolia]|uniref:uncharacterized protein LOC141617643 n=1 Tax=Silene latifolia TaxID=37657 RepID=UPI003D787003
MDLVWNCRGLNNTLTPTIPKIRALVGRKFYDFLFLIETKCNASRLFPMFRNLGFDKCFGVDAVGASGGLWVGWRKESRMSLVKACNHFIILLVQKYNGLVWYLVLFYGAPSVNLRASVLHEVEEWIGSCKAPFLMVGDFNQGPCFTWCNNRKGEQRVYERIDKAFGSKDWFTVFPNTGIKHYPIQISDHAPIEVDLNLATMSGNRPYKLDAWVLDHEECVERIRVDWKRSDKGSLAYQVNRKLSRIRTSVKRWTLDKRAEWRRKWDEFDQRLEHGMTLAIAGNGDEEYKKVNEEVTEFARAAAAFWKQRAKIKWMVNGDTCTKYFFNWVKGRAGRNYIHEIKGSDGNWHYEEGRDRGEFQKTFMDLYLSSDESVEWRDRSLFDPTLKYLDHSFPQDELDRLSRPYSAKEVRTAIFQMGALKAPGPDGIPAVFFQRCWSLVKRDFTKAILSILNSGRVLRELNRTFIALIPKKENPEGVTDYRPISLCNVVMRVMTKCIANRLAKVMSSLVGETQNAFLPGRSICDNILVAHEAINKISSHGYGRLALCAFKADISKAYDRVRWDFLEAVLDKGDMVTLVVQLIKDYCEASGQRLNVDKSWILFSPSTTLVKAQRTMKAFNIRKNNGIGKYLGIPAEFKESKQGIFNALIDHVTRRISSWNGIFPSPAGRLTLISSVLSNLSNYFLSVFKVPQKLPKLAEECGIFRQKLFGTQVVLQGMTRIRGSGCSWGIRSILHGLSIVMENIGWKPGLDSRINVWTARWVGGERPEPRNEWLNQSNGHLDNLQGDQRVMETSEHLFRDCGFSSRIWAGSFLGIRVKGARGTPMSDWIYDWIHYLRKREEGMCQVIHFVAVLWGLWTLRNRIKFQDQVVHSHLITNVFYNVVGERAQILCKNQASKQARNDMRIEEEGPSQRELTTIRNGNLVHILGKSAGCAVIRVKVDANWVRTFDAAFGWVAYDDTG